MSENNPTSVPTDAEAPKQSRFRNPLKKSDTNTDQPSKLHSAKEKAKTALAVVGVVTVAGVVAGAVAKRRGVEGLEVSLPDVDTTTTEA